MRARILFLNFTQECVLFFYVTQASKGGAIDISTPIIMEFNTDSEGKFAINLPAGTYSIVRGEKAIVLPRPPPPAAPTQAAGGPAHLQRANMEDFHKQSKRLWIAHPDAVSRVL